MVAACVSTVASQTKGNCKLVMTFARALSLTCAPSLRHDDQRDKPEDGSSRRPLREGVKVTYASAAQRSRPDHVASSVYSTPIWCSPSVSRFQDWENPDLPLRLRGHCWFKHTAVFDAHFRFQERSHLAVSRWCTRLQDGRCFFTPVIYVQMHCLQRSHLAASPMVRTTS